MDKETAPLRRAYTLWAPFYDTLLSFSALTTARRRSLAQLDAWQDKKVLLMGIGSGLDIPLLPAGADYTGIDITPAMLERARRSAKRHDCAIRLLPGNAMQLAFADGEFDRVVMHLILAVVPEPQRALQEAMRVLKPGGEILILDKFLQPGQKAPLRRALNVLSRNLATRTDVVFEDILAQCAALKLVSNQPALLRGWFRHIVLHKAPTSAQLSATE
ncbi:MAG: class I SAM-dependent methyltransferase [Pseudomonadota bacterium]